MSDLFLENPILTGLVLTTTVASIVLSESKILIVINIVILILLIIFYRKPVIERQIYEPNTVYGPCYGTVTHIIKTPTMHYITIFLSITDIHSQYYPINGKLVNRQYDMNGKFALAFEFEKASHNEKAIHTFETKDDEIIRLTQIAGTFARRITYDNKKIGDMIEVGSRLGMIHFGSRIDLELPLNYILHVKVGDKIKGPDTIIATRD